jgi:hypothetical protein
LRGLDLSIWRPWIMIIESTMPNSDISSHFEWEPLVLSANYEFVYFDGLNRYYVAAEHEELRSAFSAPPNVFDEFKLAEGHYFSFPMDRDVEAKVQAAEAKAQAAEAKAQATEAWTRETEAWAQGAENWARECDARARNAEARAGNAEARAGNAEARAGNAEARARAAEEKVSALYSSRSWRATAPLRTRPVTILKRVLGKLRRALFRMSALVRRDGSRDVQIENETIAAPEKSRIDLIPEISNPGAPGVVSPPQATADAGACGGLPDSSAAALTIYQMIHQSSAHARARMQEKSSVGIG